MSDPRFSPKMTVPVTSESRIRPARHAALVTGLQLGVIALTLGVFSFETWSEPDQFTSPSIPEWVAAVALVWALVALVSRLVTEVEPSTRDVEGTAAPRFRQLVEGLPAVSFVQEVGDAGRIRYVSPQVSAVLGFGVDEWQADPSLWSSHVHPDDRARVLAELARASRSEGRFVSEYRFVTGDGRVVWLHHQASIAPDPSGMSPAWRGVMLDVSGRKGAGEQVAFLAYHDKLTGLPNRNLFEELLVRALARARRESLAVAVLYLDVDDFKAVNDSFGHPGGDDLLRQLAERLRVTVRDADVVARQGGDEFLLLLADLEPFAEARGERPAELAQALADRVRESLREPFEVDGTEVTVSASVGFALYPTDARSARALLKRADEGMYASKRLRRELPQAAAWRVSRAVASEANSTRTREPEVSTPKGSPPTHSRMA
jgi:diguanylate cyclase (GGDEF)-like protein/PAS domain S-box-containing protein